MLHSAPQQLGTNLILADGMSGLGKSTMCQWLELQLQCNSFQARWLFEADVPHPLHWWGYWDGAQYLPPDFQAATPTQYIQASIGKWSDFAAAIHGSQQVYIVESALFLLGIGMLLQADAQPAALIDYGRRVQDILEDLNPLLLYFRQADVAAHVRKICDIRGKELENELIANMERTPYFKRRGLRGLEGVVRLWAETQQITDALFPECTIRKLALETAGGDWGAYRRQALSALSLPWVPDEQIVGASELARLTGTYRCSQGGTELTCAVVLEDGRLRIRTEHPQAAGFFFGPSRDLIPIDSHTFYAGVLPVVIAFVEDAAGGVQELRVDSTRLGGGGVRVWTASSKRS